MPGPEVVSPVQNNIKERAEQVVQTVRVIAAAPISTELFEKRLQSGIRPEDFPFSEIVLIQKCDKSDASRGLVMPVGGEIGPEESAYRGGLREVGEEITLQSTNTEQAARQYEQVFHPAFTYIIPHPDPKYSTPRSERIFTHSFCSSTFSVHEPREGKEGNVDKIARTIHLSPEELEQLIREGAVRYKGEIIRAAEHFTTLDTGIDLSEEDRATRIAVLNNAVAEIKNYDTYLKQETLRYANRERRKHKLEKATSLSDCAIQELLFAYRVVQMSISLVDERNRELTHQNTPAPKGDLLTVTNHISEAPSPMFFKLLKYIKSHEAMHAVNLLEKPFIEGIKTVTSGLKDLPEDISEKEPDEALRIIWSRVLELPLAKRVELIEKADENMRAKLAKTAGYSMDNILQGVEEAREFPNHFTDILRQQRDSGKVIFQEHLPMNEVSNSSLFENTLFAIGTHPNVKAEQDGNNVPRTVRFEANRFLAVFEAALEALKLQKEASNRLFHAGLDTMLKFPPRKRHMNLEENGKHPVYFRTIEIDGRKLVLIIDERLKKTVQSLIRKMFQEPGAIYDIHSINFALADYNFKRAKGDPVSLRLEMVDTLREALIAHLQNELGPAFHVSILPGTLKRPCLEWIEKNKTLINAGGHVDTQEITGGKRPGSKGNRIAREKFALCIQNGNGRKEVIEVNIYPFQSTRKLGINRVGEDEIFGFAEKILDDSKGGYGAKRILERPQNYPTQPSLHERQYPGEIFNVVSLRARDQNVPQRKARKFSY